MKSNTGNQDNSCPHNLLYISSTLCYIPCVVNKIYISEKATFAKVILHYSVLTLC